MIRLLIVDDHPVVVDGIRQMLAEIEDIQLVGAAFSAEQATGWLATHEVDVIILDISLPDEDGMDLCKKLMKKNPELKIIGLTTYEEVSFISRMLRNGAKGYLFKSAAQEELLTAIRTVAEGDTYLSKARQSKTHCKSHVWNTQTILLYSQTHKT